MHHATSLLALLIASGHYFDFFLPPSNRNHVEHALAQEGVALNTFICVTIHYVHFALLFRSHRCIDRRIKVLSKRCLTSCYSRA